MKSFAVVHYELYNKKDGKLVLKNFGYFESVESAKKELNSRYGRKMNVVITG